MKKRLKNNSKTKKFLDSLPSLYMIGIWAKCGVREYKFSGKSTKTGVPLVYDYYDGNGTCDIWKLLPIDYTTTGVVVAWTDNKTHAEITAKAINKAYNWE